MPDLRIDADQRGRRGKYDTVEVVVPDLEALRALTVLPGVRARSVLVRDEHGAGAERELAELAVMVRERFNQRRELTFAVVRARNRGHHLENLDRTGADSGPAERQPASAGGALSNRLSSAG